MVPITEGIWLMLLEMWGVVLTLLGPSTAKSFTVAKHCPAVSRERRKGRGGATASGSAGITRTSYKPSETTKSAAAVSLKTANKSSSSHKTDGASTKSFTINISGSMAESQKETVKKSIKSVWCEACNIPSSNVHIHIEKIDDGFWSSSGSKVTQIIYTVTVKGSASYSKQVQKMETKRLAKHFSHHNLNIVQGEVTQGQGEATLLVSSVANGTSNKGFVVTTPIPTPTITTSVETSSASTFKESHVVQTLYLSGNVGDNCQDFIEDILQKAMSKAMNGTTCTIQLLEKTKYIDTAGNMIVGFSYDVCTSAGASNLTLSSEQTKIFTNEVNNELQKQDSFQQEGVTVYTGSVQGLKHLGSADYVEILSTIAESSSEDLTSLIEAHLRNSEADFGRQRTSEIFQITPEITTEVLPNNSDMEMNQQTASFKIEGGKVHQVSHDKEFFTTQSVYFEKEVHTESQAVYVLRAQDGQT